ncbi:MAG: hypothetical protein K2R98_04375 [Gemmataceae bacterium]|nr:hypothetical protein [Gemmataceae bacterium]
MNLLKSLLLGCVVMAGVCAMAPETASAADTVCEAFTVSNETGGTVRYEVRWGNNEWKSFTLQSGMRNTHYYRRSIFASTPQPQVRMDVDTRSDVRDVYIFDMDSQFVSDPNSEDGRKYTLRLHSFGQKIGVYKN